MTRSEFEALAADYYDACDSETLSQETIADAVEHHLDQFLTPGCDVSAVIREHSPVKVRALRRAKVDDAWIEGTACTVLEHIAEDWVEEFGDPDDGGEFGAEVEAKHLPAAIALVRAFCAEETPWKCGEVGVYSYSAEEVEALMRVANPGEFEETSNG